MKKIVIANKLNAQNTMEIAVIGAGFDLVATESAPPIIITEHLGVGCFGPAEEEPINMVNAPGTTGYTIIDDDVLAKAFIDGEAVPGTTDGVGLEELISILGPKGISIDVFPTPPASNKAAYQFRMANPFLMSEMASGAFMNWKNGRTETFIHDYEIKDNKFQYTYSNLDQAAATRPNTLNASGQGKKFPIFISMVALNDSPEAYQVVDLVGLQKAFIGIEVYNNAGNLLAQEEISTYDMLYLAGLRNGDPLSTVIKHGSVTYVMYLDELPTDGVLKITTVPSEVRSDFGDILAATNVPYNFTLVNSDVTVG